MASNAAQARERMVDCQIRTSDVTQRELVDAFLQVPRDRFVPEAKKMLTYVDAEIDIGAGRTMMPPAPLAMLLQAAKISAGDVVLDVGCLTGYSTAILSRIASSVLAIEEDQGLVDSATAALSELEYDNAVVMEAALTSGYPSEGPYDVIYLNGSIEFVPDELIDQLAHGGRLVAAVGHGNAAMATLWYNDDGNISSRPLFNCCVPPLPGFAQKAEFVL